MILEDDESVRGDAVDGRRYRVPALERGVDVLEHLSHSEGGESRASLAEALGCSISQIFRVLDCLQRRSYIDRKSVV